MPEITEDIKKQVSTKKLDRVEHPPGQLYARWRERKRECDRKLLFFGILKVACPLKLNCQAVGPEKKNEKNA